MPAPTIGILAGMGPRSTGPFLDLVVSACQEIYGARHDVEFPKMLICSQPAPFYEDRPIDHAALEAATLDGLKHLESAGVDFLAIACNTVHIYYPRLAAAVSVPLLNIVELAVQAVPGSSRAIALVAARPTADSGLFQNALRAAGHELVDPDWQSGVDAMLSAVRETTDPEVFRQIWAPLLEKARAAGADTVLVACLDLSGVVRFAATRLAIVDAADCLARAVVQQWIALAKRGTTMRKSIKDLLAEASSQVKTYQVAEAKQRLGDDDVVFIDVRDEPELQSDGKIPGAVHASRGMLEFYIDRESPYHKDVFDSEKEFIFYCKSGGRSALAAQRAKEMGLERVASMQGGFTEWKGKGEPVEKV